MAEIRRGTAMLLLTAGDKEISTALADGILAVRLPMVNSLSHAARASSLGEGALTKEQREVVSREIKRQRTAEELREEMHPVPVDYALMLYDAEVRYGEDMYEPGALERLGQRLLIGYGLVVWGFHRLFQSLGMER